MNRTYCVYRAALLFGFLAFVGPERDRVHAQDEKPQETQAAPTAGKPKNILLRLAEQCSKNTASVSGCRTFTTNEKQEYVILKDNAPEKPQAYLLIPVEPVTGVDDDKIFSPPVVDLWSSAWLWSEKYPGKPAALTGLAVNSVLARSENQLHIHISCILPDVTKTLWKKRISQDANRPTLLKLGPNHTPYRVVAVPTLDSLNSPFAIARTMAQATKTEMKDHGIAAVQGKKSRGYYVLDTTEGRGGAEELLDQSCAIK
jgi:CDP-diacylglycerol pyrophosphatase